MLATCLLALMTPAPAPVQTTAPPIAPVHAAPELKQRADQVVALLGGRGDYTAIFSDSFRAAVPKATFDRITAQLAASLGKPTGIETLNAVTPWSARLRIGYEKGVVNADIVVDPAGVHPVSGLMIKGAGPRVSAATIDAVVAELAALPGRTGFALARLGDGPPVTLNAHDAAQPLAIGSAFKLVILAELARSIAAGERTWTDVVTLDGSALPGGGYTQQPKGTKISFRELAERMISVSDNSATDILLFHLGREKVEAMLPVVGMTDGAPRNEPFLGTLELFKLKGVDGGALGARYLTMAPAARRDFLDKDVARSPIAAIPKDLFQNKRPIRIDELEWFASPNDLIRTMDWLRRHSEGPAGADLRAILSKNPGLPEPARHWAYAGYKGGSEPGVLNMTFLLRAGDGGWYALSGGWNDPAKDVDLLRFSGLIGRALELAAPK
jgi:beta-lactamase class A